MPLIAFIIIFSTVYTKILSKSMENYTKSNFKFKQGTLRKSSKIKALLVKEIKRYFSSPIYVINTIFGIILLIIMLVMWFVLINMQIDELLEVRNVKY